MEVGAQEMIQFGEPLTPSLCGIVRGSDFITLPPSRSPGRQLHPHASARSSPRVSGLGSGSMFKPGRERCRRLCWGSLTLHVDKFRRVVCSALRDEERKGVSL